MKPLVATICLIVISSALAMPIDADDLSVARSLEASLTRIESSVMVRAVENPTRASLDVASYDRNPIFHYPGADPVQPPPELPALAALDFGGALDGSTIRDSIEATPLTAEERAMPLAWQPLTKYLIEHDYDLAAPLLVTGAGVSSERWGSDGARPLQQIALAYLHGDQLWVKVEFRPELTWIPAGDEDGDGYREIYARLAVDSIAPALREIIVGDYAGKLLTADEVGDYFYSLTSDWYAAMKTFLLEGEEASPWPNPSTHEAAAAQVTGAIIEAPTAVIRGEPFGEPIYNVFVVRTGGEGTPEARLGPTLPAVPGVEPHEAVLLPARLWDVEVQQWGGTWDAWEEMLLRFRVDVRRLLQDMPEGVNGVAGRNDWLFFRTDLRFLLSGDLREQPVGMNPWPAIIDFRDQLQARGIDLLMVIIPTKGEIYPDRLSAQAPGTEGPWVTPRLRKFLSELSAAGVDVVDLQPAFMAARDLGDEPLYMPQDTHWTNRGAQLAADLIGRRVQEYPWYRDLEISPDRYRTQPATCARLGDIVGMLPEAKRAAFRPMQLAAEQVIDADGSLYLDDPSSPVVMLGDSFTGVFHFEDCKHAGVSAHVARELGLPIDLVMAQGSGPRIRAQLARRGAEDLATKRLVIWTMVSRDLHEYWATWDPVQLP